MKAAKPWLLLSAFALTLTSCSQKIPLIRACGIAGLLSDGADCASTLEDGTWSLSLGQVIEMLEAQPARECVPVPGMNLCSNEPGESVWLPARAGALLVPAEDFQDIKVFIEQACRKMKCRAEVIQAVERVSRVQGN